MDWTDQMRCSKSAKRIRLDGADCGSDGRWKMYRFERIISATDEWLMLSCGGEFAVICVLFVR